MDDYIHVNKKDPRVSIKIKDMLAKYERLPCKYQSKIGYDTLIQNVILKEIINLMSVIIMDKDIELKIKNGRIEYLERRNSYNWKKKYIW